MDDVAVLKAALFKIYNPKKYHHREPDDYTQVACFQFVAQEALKAVGALDESGNEVEREDKPNG